MTREDLRKIAMCYAHDELKDNHGDVEDVVASAFMDGANYADAHPHWISVEDELPKIGKDVLVLREDGEMQVAHQYNEEIARWWSVDGFPLKNNITHWMPMPQAPHHIIDANKKVDRVIGTADHIKTALDVLNKKGDEK